MSDRRATALVADEILFSFSGKLHLQGIYTGHLTIHGTAAKIPQLIIFVVMEGDKDDPLRSAAVEVTLPGESPVRQDYPIAPPNYEGLPDAKRWMARFPLAIMNTTLRPGRILGKVIHDQKEMPLALPWIVSIGGS